MAGTVPPHEAGVLVSRAELFATGIHHGVPDLLYTYKRITSCMISRDHYSFS